MKKINLLIITATFLVAFTTKNEVKPPKKEEIKQSLPNIVFILSDDQAWTDYGFMGDKNIETPRLDKFASESLTFKHGYVPTPLCSPSLATIITGLYPKDHGILGNDAVYNRDKESKENGKNRAEAYKPIITQFEKQVTLPDMLKQKGYLSFQTGKWWHGNHKIGGFDYGMTHGDPKRGGRHGDFGLEIGRKGLDTINSYVDLALREKNHSFCGTRHFYHINPIHHLKNC
ncbi:sulfatase-like hydrolase/transferase [Lutibacter sp. HS1-25]|uniref:sulfatase-like hydrolase/transferase n=1 Tax=Lutibacter sp. HS1-25 TaxID=2485000 RepID=UPI00197C0CE7|nr:sulfatase-like hydrolase/transferase [Lutibacter sp. HS1-25]